MLLQLYVLVYDLALVPLMMMMAPENVVHSAHLPTGRKKTLPEVMLLNYAVKLRCRPVYVIENGIILTNCEVGVSVNFKWCSLGKVCAKYCVTGLLHCFTAHPKTDICGGRPVTAAYAILICFPCCARCAGSMHFLQGHPTIWKLCTQGKAGGQ